MNKKISKQISDIKYKILRDLRINAYGLPIKALYPYDYQYAEIFRNILNKKGLLCPNYDHIFIQIGESDFPFPHSDWSSNVFELIDYKSYISNPENEKERIVFNLIIRGLKNIATRDKLDQSIIDNTVFEVSKLGLDTELEFKTIENKKYTLRITYFSRSMEILNPVYFELVDKVNSISKKIEIGKVNHLQIPQWLRLVTLTNSKITIKSSNSIWANVILKDMPQYIEYNINEFFK